MLGEEEAILVECKWSSKPVEMNILANLERKAAIIQGDLGNKKSTLLYAQDLIYTSIDGFISNRSDIMLFKLSHIIG